MRTIIGLTLQTNWRYKKFQWAKKHTTKINYHSAPDFAPLCILGIGKIVCPYYKGEFDVCGNKKCPSYALFNDERLADAFKKYKSSELKLRDKLYTVFGEEGGKRYMARKLMSRNK
ncbi:MAG: hypothetical protein J6Y07_00155 [Alphaproteobacteria bacterium]|nr:hypothetical protein [Alphaproteobacteria bacterium]